MEGVGRQGEERSVRMERMTKGFRKKRMRGQRVSE